MKRILELCDKYKINYIYISLIHKKEINKIIIKNLILSQRKHNFTGVLEITKLGEIYFS